MIFTALSLHFESPRKVVPKPTNHYDEASMDKDFKHSTVLLTYL